MLKADDEGMVNTMEETEVKSATDAIGSTNIYDVGSIWDTMGGKVDEGNTEIVVGDVKVGARVGGMDI
ncbi:hypothetical protein KI387_024363, partial [Taxus chinensis]